MTGEKDSSDHIPDAGNMVDAPAEMPGVIEQILLTHTGLQFATEADRARLRDRLWGLFNTIEQSLFEETQAYMQVDLMLRKERELRLAAEGQRDDFMRVATSRGQEIERLKEMRKRLDRRIHCQRKANRDNWEIVESRRKWLGSQTAQRAWALQRDRRLAAEAALAGERERCALIAENETIHPLGEQIAAAIRAEE